MKMREIATLHVVSDGWLVTIRHGDGLLSYESTFVCKQWDEVLERINEAAWDYRGEKVTP